MKKGLTLMELLVVIIIIGAIALITLPIINGVIRNSRQNLFEFQVNEIEKAAQDWMYKNIDCLPPLDAQKCNTSAVVNFNNNNTTIRLLTLKESGLVEIDIRDPRNDCPFNEIQTTITITVENNSYTYKVNPVIEDC